VVDEDALDLFEQMVAVDKFEQSVLGCAERQCRDRAAGGFGYRVAFSTTAITSLIALGLLRLQMAPRWRTLTQPVALASSASS